MLPDFQLFSLLEVCQSRIFSDPTPGVIPGWDGMADLWPLCSKSSSLHNQPVFSNGTSLETKVLTIWTDEKHGQEEAQA